MSCTSYSIPWYVKAKFDFSMRGSDFRWCCVFCSPCPVKAPSCSSFDFSLNMTCICIGPVCIPISAIIPFVILWFKPIMRFILGLFGVKEEVPQAGDAPEPVTARTAPEGTMHITDADHWKSVLNEAKEKDLAIIVDCTATWCGPCKMIAPHFEMLAKQHNGYFVKVDVDECDEVAQQLSIRSMPTFVAFKDGKETERFSGANQGKLGYMVSRLCPRIVAATDVAAADQR